MSKYKNICVSESNYKTLKEMGHAGDSFNDVLTKLLEPRPNKDSDQADDGVIGV
ncbi:MAG: antitoxin VapB family protein [Nitrososphaeraceae archaeon]